MADYVTEDEVLAAWAAFESIQAVRRATLLTAASRRVDQYCRRTFEYSAAITETLDGDGSPVLYLSRPPVVSIASITVEGTALDNTNADAWKFKSLSGEVRRGTGRVPMWSGDRWPEGLDNITVVYAGGYQTIPDVVKEATILTLQSLASTNGTSSSFRREKLGTDYEYEQSEEMIANPTPPQVKLMLNPYRLRYIS